MPLVFPSPPISLTTAHCLAAFFAFSYVGSLYIFKNARLSFSKKTISDITAGAERRKEHNERWRDDPDVIRARLTVVSISTVLSCGVVFGLVNKLIETLIGSRRQNLLIALESTLARLGFTLVFRDQYPFDLIYPCLTAPALFLGPLYAYWLSGILPLQSRWSFRFSVVPLVASWQGWRNYILGPITEEVVFRACTVAVYHMAGVPCKQMIFLTPLTFGAAHLHHAWDTFNRYGRTMSAAKRALFMSMIQLAYTSLFGFHCAFLFLRTGSIIPPIVSHIFCNIMGVPQYSMHVRSFPHRSTSIKLAYILGIIAYIYTMRNWTLADDTLYWPGPWSPRY